MKNLLKKLSELDGYKYNTISGLNDGEKCFLPSLFNTKTLIVANNDDSLLNYEEQLSALGKRVVTFSSMIPLVISRSERAQHTYKDYCINLSKLATDEYDIVLASASALFQKLPHKDFVLSNILTFKKGQDCKIGEIVKKLINLGYVSQEIVSDKGEFSLKGDVLDIFAINYDVPIRLNFFDTEIEKINFFDPITFKQTFEVEEVEIFLCTFLDSSRVDLEKVEQEIETDMLPLKLDAQSMLRLTEIVSSQLEYFKNGLSGVSSVFFLPFCDYFGASLFDYLPNDAKIVIDEPKLVTDKLKFLEDSNVGEFLELSLKGEFLPRTMQFYSQRKDILENFLKFNLVAYSRILSQNRIFSSEYVINFICPQNIKYKNHFVELTDDCKNYLKNKDTVVLSCALDLTLNKVKNFFDEAGLSYVEIKSLQDVEDGKINLTLQNLPFSANFEMEKFILIGSEALNSQKVLKIAGEGPTSASSKPKYVPKVGDYVVHQVHGVGKCVGIKNLKLTNIYRDYIIIEYKDGDLLYLPPENADMITYFVGEDSPKCNKIGGTEFFKVKQKVKTSIKKMAFDLIQVYSARLNSKGFKYSKDSYLQTEFENAFSYPYTDDQADAIKQIKLDMESGKIMDRLICGDVGFGKTEVALVAAFKAIQDGKQVAIISPTTILCEQHYNTALSRMKNFMVNVEAINRFKTKKEQDKILEDLKNGKIDLICGTHRLFSNDVKFKDLGLIILDEEQRFGVEDKEKLKNIKKTVNVLSLSATPIPRTLYMSLVGIRDVSFLSTPPKQRKPITTAVIDYSDSLLASACKKEIERDGQVLIVYNRVESITNFYAHVRALLPYVNIGLAHGQMNSKMLESAIYDLYSRKTQVLISTVLIENGIDLPYANTLFVIDSDKLGLSQLYQLRGRIGRSNIEAYAYFSFSKNKTLTQDSYKRLDAIMEFSDFGSGYKIALRDLEIRGAGDVLGKLQHGHIEQVGYDMYIKLLNEAVSELKGEAVEEVKEVKIDISLSAYLPDGYIKSDQNRISFYTKVSKISTQTDFNAIVEETIDRYGPLPKPVLQLCKVGLIKNLAQKIGAMRIKLDEFSCKVTLYKEDLNDKLVSFLSEKSANYAFAKDPTPVVTIRKLNTPEQTQDELLKFLTTCVQIKNK